MKTNIKKITLILAAIIILSVGMIIFVSAANTDMLSSVSFVANTTDSNTVVKTQTVEKGGKYLFLPSAADINNLVLELDGTTAEFSGNKGKMTVTSGVAFDLTAIASPVDGKYTVKIDGKELVIMNSANVRSLFYVSDDAVNKGRAWVDADKSNKATGVMSMIGADGDVDYTDTVTEFKGRGNSTFTDYLKKPYQMKIKNKTALIEGSTEKLKKYVLLANAPDYTLIHNSITFDLAEELGISNVSDYESVDLYYDGEYRGTYLLTEKVEVASNSVDIDDLDERIEDANAGTDAYENPVVVTKTTASKGETDAAANSKGSYKYVAGLTEPELPEGAEHHAYLLELEFAYRYKFEQSGFVTNRGQAIVTKNPEYLTKDSGAFIASYWQEFEDAVYSENGYNAATGKYYYDYCDLESLVNIYLINELGKNHDSFYSSVFFYLPADSDIMRADTVWDYDISYGVGHRNRDVAANPEYFFSASRYLVKELITIESFRDAVKETLNPETGKFYNAVQTLLGENGSISTLSDTIYQSQQMNYNLWNVYADNYYYYNPIDGAEIVVVKEGKAENYDNAIEFLEYFIDERINWLSAAVCEWDGDNYELPLDPPTPEVPEEPEEPVKELTFFEKIAEFFRKIFEWFANLFK